MRQDVEIRLLGDFELLIRGASQRSLAAKSRKGVSLMEYLILQQGKPVSTQRLVRELWSGGHYGSPENALKTMVSRFRALLNELRPDLGKCIVSEQGGYRWETLPFVKVDVLDMLSAIQSVTPGSTVEEKTRAYRRVVELYRGDLYQTGDISNIMMQVSWLHREYLNTVYAWIELLKEADDYEEIIQVCTAAGKVDGQDEQIRIEMMRAMVKLDRATEAMTEFNRMTHLDIRPDSAEYNLQASTQQLLEAGQLVSRNLDAIRNELIGQAAAQEGPFFCGYEAFKEFFNIQVRNLERLGATMFLCVMMINGPEGTLSSVTRESGMAGLTEILRKNLRRGDIVTRFSPSIIAMLLPTVTYATGGMVMERIERLFYEEYSSKTIVLHSRISPLSGKLSE